MPKDYSSVRYCIGNKLNAATPRSASSSTSCSSRKPFLVLVCLQKITKTGSLCCVAARPHGSSFGSREWSMGHNEPFWRTNTSFSPPVSRRWDQRFHTEGLSNESHGDIGIALSSLSSNSKESRSWVRGEQLPHHTYSSSDGAMSYLSSSSDIIQTQQLPLLPVQGFHISDYVSAAMKESLSGPLLLSQFAEGTSRLPNGGGSNSSCSDGCESEAISRIHLHGHRNFSSRCSFKSKLVHPVSFPDRTREVEEGSPSGTTNSNRVLATEPQSYSGILDSANLLREAFPWSSGSSIDFADVADQMEHEFPRYSPNSISDRSKCGLCERLLSQRSPWSSRRIIRSGDMPIAGVLSCWHVFHAECLERITPKTRIHDPPCPLCEKKMENAREQWAASRLKIGIPRLRSLGEEGQSRLWSCVQVGDCVGGALHASPRNSLLNRCRLKRHMSPPKGNPGKGKAAKSKSGISSSRAVARGELLEQGVVGCSRAAPAPAPAPALKRW